MASTAAHGKLLTKHLDIVEPKRDPRTDDYCIRCKRDLKPGQPRRFIHCIEGGLTILHPSNEALYVPDGGDMGAFPIGIDCAKRIGLDWSHA